jgi:protein-tyrosine kinase
MTIPSTPVHLVERAARRLHEAASLAGEDPREPPAALAAAALPFVPLAPAEPPAPEPPPLPGLEMATLERAGMIRTGKRQRDRISEEFRLVQGRLLHNMAAARSAQGANPGANLVMLTSARIGEGKSFAAINLAASIARYGKRSVLLVDADAKQNALTDLLGLTEAPGLLDLAANPARTPNEMVVRTSFPNLSVLPIGGSGQRRELSASISVVGLVEQLTQRFANRIILLDAPPCLSSSDPAALALVVGQIVMVVEAERTQRSELQSALDLVQTCPLVTLLLNKTRLTGADTFGAYS